MKKECRTRKQNKKRCDNEHPSRVVRPQADLRRDCRVRLISQTRNLSTMFPRTPIHDLRLRATCIYLAGLKRVPHTLTFGVRGAPKWVEYGTRVGPVALVSLLKFQHLNGGSILRKGSCQTPEWRFNAFKSRSILTQKVRAGIRVRLHSDTRDPRPFLVQQVSRTPEPRERKRTQCSSQ